LEQLFAMSGFEFGQRLFEIIGAIVWKLLPTLKKLWQLKKLFCDARTTN
jgi:hypothetical protein